jgi:hypothetical protein
VRPPCIVITCIYNDAAPLRPPKTPGRTASILLLIHKASISRDPRSQISADFTWNWKEII